MPPINHARKGKVSEKPAAKAAEKTVTKVASQKDLKNREARAKVLESFLPEVREFFSANLGLDLEALDAKVLYDIKLGKLTKPLDLTVVPQAYDRALDRRVDLAPMHVVAGLIVNLPRENGEMVAPDEKHRLFINTVPCRPMMEKSDGVSDAPAAGEAEEEAAEARGAEKVTFTEEQLMALEGIGVDRSRLFGGFNVLPRSTREDIAEGRPFYVDGVVRTSWGYVNVSGVAELLERDGAPAVTFQPTSYEQRTEGKVVDILGARRIGMLELDLFKRGANDRIVKDVNGMYVLNEAGANLVNYGFAMEPVKGFVHGRKYDEKEKKFKDTAEVGWYQVGVAYGSLVARKMKEIKARRAGTQEVYTRLEVPEARVVEGKVYVDGKNAAPLAFKSERDLTDYLEGRGGVVVGASFHDKKHEKDVSYNAFVVPDLTRGGFARQFSPETTEKILKARGRKDAISKAMKPRKQNFSMSI